MVGSSLAVKEIVATPVVSVPNGGDVIVTVYAGATAATATAVSPNETSTAVTAATHAAETDPSRTGIASSCPGPRENARASGLRRRPVRHTSGTFAGRSGRSR